MIKTSLLLFSLLFYFSSQAQDKKTIRLFDRNQYCDCINHINKNRSKIKTPEVLFIEASSYYQLYINPDNDCRIKVPLTKCLTVLIKIRKGKTGYSTPGLELLYVNAVSSGIQSYRDDMAEKKWEAALTMIERLKKIEAKSSLIIDQAVCEYGLAKSTALETACLALNSCKSSPDKKDQHYVLNQANNILLSLDSSMNKDFHPFMDSLFKNFQDNDIFAFSFYNHWKNEIRKHKSAGEYNFMFKTIDVIFKYYPDKKEWKDEMSSIVILTADSLTQDFLDNEENFQSYIACCQFLMEARISLQSILPDLKNTKYYGVKTKGSDFAVNMFSASIGTTTTIKFSFDKYWKTKNEIVFDAVVPGVKMEKIKGFLWVDSPLKKRAKRGTDLVKSESFNSFLLDSLCHSYCNKFRIENNRKPLFWSKEIYRASKHHSKTQACLGCMIHGELTDPIYGNPESIQYYLEYFSPMHFSSGENVLYAYISENMTYDSLAEKIIRQWISSPGHRENMLEEIFKSEAISTTVSNYNGQFAAFLENAIAQKYYPEINQLLEVFPEIKRKMLDPSIIYFSSQNFNGER